MSTCICMCMYNVCMYNVCMYNVCMYICMYVYMYVYFICCISMANMYTNIT